MRKISLVLLALFFFFVTSPVYSAYRRTTTHDLNRPLELQRFFQNATLNTVQEAVTSGRLDPTRIFGSDSMLDFAITHIPNFSQEKALIIKYLIDKGADVNHKGNAASILCRAVQICRADVITVLLDAGATNTYNMYGLSLAELAEQNRNLQGTSIISRLQSVE
ncbi:MAG: hypothetical protein IJU48_05995 [Synergistaceae bacterium]|nr:hypothetical protein [Synergistaceae bacterium]